MPPRLKDKMPLIRRVSSLEKGHEQHAAHIARLDADISEIRLELSYMPKKDDLMEVRAHIDHSINGILKDALSSVPQRAMVTWTVVLAAIAAISFLMPVIIKLLER